MAMSKVLPLPGTTASQPSRLVSEPSVRRGNLATALLQAVLRARFSKVKFLLDNGVSLDTKNDQDQNLLVTALYIPQVDKREKMFRFLLRRGVDCCQVDQRTGRDVLGWASVLGCPQQVKAVLEAALGEVNVNRKDQQGKTALHHATLGGHTEVVQLLVDNMCKYGLPVDVSDDDGRTPYIYAKKCGHMDIARVLLTRGQASAHQFDSMTFHSADTWADIGLKERKVEARRDKVRQLASYKIRGRLPPIHQSRQPPVPKVRTAFVDSSDITMETDRRSDSNPDSNSVDSGMAGDDGSQKTPWTSRMSYTTGVGGGGGGYYNKSSLPTLTNKSLDTAFTLWTMTHDSADNPPAQFVGSQFDSTKSQEYHAGGRGGDITGLMAVLADQQTESFRKVAKPPTPPPPVHQPPQQKPKVSTLAILFGRDSKGPKKGQRHRQRNQNRSRTSSMMGQSKPGKKLSDDRARERRLRRTTGLPSIPAQPALTTQ